MSTRGGGEGVRRILQVGKKGMAREALKEMALMPWIDKSPEWPYRNTFNMTEDSGFRQSRFRPRFDKRAKTGMTKDALKDGSASFTTGGEEWQSEQDPMNPMRANELKPPYTSGIPLPPTELRTSGPHAPVENGVRICRAILLGQDAPMERNVLTTPRCLD